MKKRSRTLALVLCLAVAAVAGRADSAQPSRASCASRSGSLQGVTIRHPHPPAGDAGDVFSVDLTLFTTGNDFDAAPQHDASGT